MTYQILTEVAAFYEAVMEQLENSEPLKIVKERENEESIRISIDDL